MREIDAGAFGKRVADRREKLGMSQEELAAATNQSQSNIAWIEKGGSRRDTAILGHAHALAQPLQTSAEWLLWEEGPEQVGPAYLAEGALLLAYGPLTVQEKAELTRFLERLKKSRGKPRNAS